MKKGVTVKKFIALSLCFISIFAFSVCAYALERTFISEEITYVNPLYEDVISEDDFSEEEIFPILSVDDGGYYTDVAEAAEILLEGLLEKNQQISFRFICKFEEKYTIAETIFHKALEHNGNPVCGDYILGQIGGWKAKLSGYQDGNDLYLTITYYSLSYYTNAEQESKVDKIIKEKLDSFNLEGKSDYEKIKIIYDYICSNVTYDYKNLNDSSYKLKYTAYAALINKTAVCQGYSMLLYRFALEAGIDARYITGYQTSTGGGHGWNIVQINGKYYDLDVTWDAGRSSYSYFLKSEEDFVNHTRDPQYLTEEFTSSYPISTKTFDPATDDIYIASGYCGEKDGKNLSWTLDKMGTLTINGTGRMADYDDYNGTPVPWGQYRDKITKLVLGEGITYIGEYAFSDCSKITGKLELPESLTAIGWYAFQKCSGFTGRLEIPDGVTSIGEWAFHKCSGFTGELVLPEGITRIGMQAFYNCSGLSGKLYIPEKVTSIDSWAFYGCGIDEFYFKGDAPDVKTASDKFPSFNAEEDTIHFNADKNGWDLDENGLWNGYKAVKIEKQAVVYGDIDGNGKINIMDANLVRRATAKLVTLDENQVKAADVDGNGKINILDANLIRRYTAKLVAKFPAEG